MSLADRLPPLERVSAFAPAAILVVFAVASLALWLPGGGNEVQSVPAARAALDARLAAGSQRLADLKDATNARPVFHGSRRPLAQPEAPVAAEPVLNLLGVISDGGEKVALLQVSNRTGLFSLGKGETIGRWELLDIGTEHVLVSKDGGEPFNLRID